MISTSTVPEAITDRTASIKERQRKHWNTVAAGWGAWLAWTRRNFEPLTTWFEEAARWTPGAHILDVACGAGYPAIDAATIVGPDGNAVAIDISSEMIAVASERAAALGIGNIEFKQMDAEALSFDDRAFDAVTSAYGLMFCPNPNRALEEGHRVLVPGGRIGIAVWDEPSRSPFLTVIRHAAAGLLSLPEPAPDEPHPFRLASADGLASMLEAAGFVDVRVESFPMRFECASADEYCRLFADLSIKSRIAALAPNEAARFNDAVAQAVQPYTTDGAVQLIATSLRASGKK